MQPGARIAQKYRVIRPLGEGAMGSVWAAENELTQREFAIKLIHRSHVMATELRERLLREARACGRLRHKNVVEIYDVGETDDGDPFLVMELLDGETLEALLSRRRRLAPLQLAAIGAQVANALMAAHQAGIIHRDLKPANVFLHRDPDLGTIVKVLDFGVSKLVSEAGTTTTTGAAVGSPAYMSPEQATARPGIDQRADIWSLGVVLYEASVGRPAFEGDTAFEVVGNILHGTLPDPSAVSDLDPRLAHIIKRCIERDADQRWSSARELAAALEELLPRNALSVLKNMDEDEPTLGGDRRAKLASGEPVSAPRAASARHPTRLRGVLPLALALIGVAALALIAIVTVALSRRGTTQAAASAPTLSSAVREPQVAVLYPHAEPQVVPLTSASTDAGAKKNPPHAARPTAPLVCPDDKVIFGSDGKKRCALPGRRAP